MKNDFPEETKNTITEDVSKDALDAALDGDKDVDLKALVFEMFKTVSEEKIAEMGLEEPAVSDTEPSGSESGPEEKDEKDPKESENESAPASEKSRIKEMLSNRAILAVEAVLILLIIFGIARKEPPAETEGIRLVNTTYNSVQLEWDATEDADGYRVFRSRDGKKYGYVGSTAEPKYTDTSVRTGTTYYYTITGRDGLKAGEVDPKNSITASPQLDRPKFELTTDNGSMDIKITPVDGATGYAILRDGEEVGKTTETDFTDEKAEGDTDYTYSVKAYRYKESPVYSKQSEQVEAKLETLGDMDVKTRGEDLYFSWEPAEKYTSFKVYKDGELADTITDTSYTISGFELDKIYDVSVIGYSEDEKARSPEEERTFKVEEVPMDNAGAIEAACEWGVNIANDNSFTYGTGNRAHHSGCYFCGTNVGPNLARKGTSKVNGHSYAKTYCCNPFVHACYAHGAGDSNMLAACRKGRSVGMKESTYTRYGNWKNVGRPAYSDLRRGDVIIKSSHVVLYLGDGQIVHAGSEGWGADSIEVEDFSSRRYGQYSFVMRYTGTGSGTMYTIEDVEPEDQSKDAEDAAAETDKASEDKAESDSKAEADKRAEENKKAEKADQ